MQQLVALIPALPLAGFLILALGRRLPARAVALVATAAVGASMAAAIAVAFSLPAGGSFTHVCWQWMAVGTFTPRIAFYVDPLAIVMTLVVTTVSFLIHVYSTKFMAEEEGYGRFFAYMNLFVASMLILVLADNLLLLYLGWEGVGLCSYLLIGFWYKDAANGRAAMKAFIVTRVGDAAMMVGLFVIYFGLGTLDIQEAMAGASKHWAVGSGVAIAAAALLLGGAVGKSAQLPLQTWLPDAMAGPTPVSALIHAATMVTAGVYLIARTHVLFTLAPPVQLAVALVGLLTLLLAGCSAVVQSDIKRVLAYSTISQVGYMFLALGVGAWSGAIFHLVTHALFKSLLFLGAGAVILALHHEHNLFKMGGLRRAMPVTFWTFLIGAMALAALPPVTAGLASKDLILSHAWAAPHGGVWLWFGGIVGAFLTALYTSRLVFLAFFGEQHQQPGRRLSLGMGLPLVLLAGACLVAGFLDFPKILGGSPHLTDFLSSVWPAGDGEAGAAQLGEITEFVLGAVALGASLLGVLIGYLVFLRNPSAARNLALSPGGAAMHRFWLAGWGFDRIYDVLFVRPLVWVARINRSDFLDLPFRGIARASVLGHRAIALTQTGRVRWYAAGVACGAVILIALVVLL
jgi:NADH-quinone oxidoreductase subunit L